MQMLFGITQLLPGNLYACACVCVWEFYYPFLNTFGRVELLDKISVFQCLTWQYPDYRSIYYRFTLDSQYTFRKYIYTFLIPQQ